MVFVYHTICANCDTKYNFIQESDKDSTKCNNCGVYLYDSYEEICDELYEELDMCIQNKIKEYYKNYNKKNIIKVA